MVVVGGLIQSFVHVLPWSEEKTACFLDVKGRKSIKMGYLDVNLCGQRYMVMINGELEFTRMIIRSPAANRSLTTFQREKCLHIPET